MEHFYHVHLVWRFRIKGVSKSGKCNWATADWEVATQDVPIHFDSTPSLRAGTVYSCFRASALQCQPIGFLWCITILQSIDLCFAINCKKGKSEEWCNRNETTIKKKIKYSHMNELLLHRIGFEHINDFDICSVLTITNPKTLTLVKTGD